MKFVTFEALADVVKPLTARISKLEKQVKGLKPCTKGAPKKKKGDVPKIMRRGQ